MPTNEQESPQGPAVTDSPWFWVAIFAGMAIVALLAVGPKYSHRQQGVERKFLARQEIARQRSGADAAASEQQADLLATESTVDGGEQFNHDTASDGQDSQSGLIVPLWRLMLLVSGVLVVAVVMLVRGRGSAASSPSTPSTSRIHKA